MKKSDAQSERETQGFSFKTIESYIRTYAKNYRRSYLSLLSM